jgi:hypothetical protein
MITAVTKLEPLGANRTPHVLTPTEIVGLEENARLVARIYWKKLQRTAQSVQNQLDLGRWHFLDQSIFAKDVILEIATDAGMTLKFYP